MDARSAPNTIVKSRIGLAAGLCAAGFSIIVARLFEVMVFGASLAGAADAAPARQPMRADFVDRNGVLIARDLEVGAHRLACGRGIRSPGQARAEHHDLEQSCDDDTEAGGA